MSSQAPAQETYLLVVPPYDSALVLSYSLQNEDPFLHLTVLSFLNSSRIHNKAVDIIMLEHLWEKLGFVSHQLPAA